MSIHKRIGSGAVISLSILLQSITAAAAQDSAPSSSPDNPKEPGDWAIAAGVGFDGPSYSIGAYSRLGPVWGLTLERRLGRRTWLLLGASGQYSASFQGSPSGGYEVRYWSIEGHTGLRYVFNPGKAFQFSSYVIAGASHGRAYQWEQRSMGIGVQGTLGLSVDRALTEDIGVRISTNIASSGFSYTSHESIGDPNNGYDSAGFYSAVGLQPAIELRMTF